MKDWTPSDIRNVLDSALDGFAHEFFGVASYKRLDRKDKLKIMRAVKADVACRFAYEWMMRTA